MEQAIEIVSAEIAKVWIKEACAEAGITQEELARRVNVSYRQLNRVALNESEPSLLLAYRIRTILQKPIDKLFEFQYTARPARPVMRPIEKAWATRRRNEARERLAKARAAKRAATKAGKTVSA